MFSLGRLFTRMQFRSSFICRDHQGSCHGMIEEQNFNLHLILHGKEKKIISKNPDDWLGYTVNYKMHLKALK